LQYAPSLRREAKTAALEIRLRRCASFQEKLHQLVGKYPTKRRPKPGAFWDRFRDKF
jgi:hypothetical protein